MGELFWPTNWIGWTVMVVSILLVFLPAKYDPAVRLRNWLEKRRG